MPKLPVPSEGIVLTHCIVSDDVKRSRRFYTEVLGGETSAPVNRRLSGSPTAGSSSTSAVDQPTTSRRSHSRRRPILIGSAASSISGWRISQPCTPTGARQEASS